MTSSVDEQQDEIAAACRQFGIERLFVFWLGNKRGLQTG